MCVEWLACARRVCTSKVRQPVPQTVCSPSVNIQSPSPSFSMCALLWLVYVVLCVPSFYACVFLCSPNHRHAKRLGTRPASLLFHGLLASKEPVAVVLRSCRSDRLKPLGSSLPSVLCPSLPARSFHGITASSSRQARTALSAQQPRPHRRL